MENQSKISIKTARKIYLENKKKLTNEDINSFVSLKNINKVYPNKVQAVFDFNLDINSKDFIVLVGPSGCGKSTTLRMIAGLEEISSGYLYIDKVLSNYLASKDRGIAMVFQSYALYPHMTVYENISYGLRVRKEELPLIDKKTGKQIVGIDELKLKSLIKKLGKIQKNNKIELEEKNKLEKELLEEIEYVKKDVKPLFVTRHYTEDEIKEKVFTAADILDLGAYLDRKPKELSGGQMQRVALGRAIVRNSKLFLMDEPLSNLDAKLRVQMRSEIVKIHKKVGATTIYVTHDQTEAMTMATKIVVMNKGWIQQVGKPIDIYMNPENLFVATFIGAPAMNIIEGTYNNGSLILKNGNIISYNERLKEQHDVYYKKNLEFYKKLYDRFDKTNDIALADSIKEIIKLSKLNKNDNFDELFNKVIEIDYSNILKDRYDNISEYIEIVNDKSNYNSKNIKFVIKNLNLIVNNLLSEEDSIVDFELRKILANQEFTNKKETVKVLDVKTKKEKIKEIIREYDDYLINPHKIKIGVRPEDISLIKSQDNDIIELNTSIVELIGSDYFVHMDYDNCDFIAKIPNSYNVGEGHKVKLKIDVNKVHLFDTISGRTITKLEVNKDGN